MNEILLAKSDSEIKACYAVAVQLRPSYTPASFLAQVKKQQIEHYNLAYLKNNGQVCAIAGFRYLENLAWGKFLYVDDLVTAEQQRSKGYGKYLLDWLLEQARSNQCKQLELDSGVQRIDAHRFYAREKLQHTSLHYSISFY